MAFPANPLDATAELYIDGSWVDVTTDTLSRDQVVISRGRMSEGSRTVPTSCAMSIRNTGGTYSPRNPGSAYYGMIGRNTPLRVYTGTAHLGAGGGSGTASTSHVAPSVTATGAGLLVCGWMADGPVNYTLPVSMTAGPAETDGSFSTMRTAYETVAAGATGTRTATASTSQGYASVSAVAHGTVAVEETLSGVSITIDDVTLTTGAATEAGWWLVAVQGWIRGFDVPMPDAPYGDDGGWILLGDSTAIAGATGAQSVYLRVRVWARRVAHAGAQKVILPGIAARDASDADNHGALYVLSGVSGWSIRATVEVPSWPSRWDVSGSDVWVPIEGQGILRRLQQGASPLKSPMRRAVTGAGATVQVGVSLLPVAYWPLEDASGSTRAASGLPSGAPMSLSGAVEWSSVSSPGSLPLPDWSQSTGYLTGPVSGVVSGDSWGVGCLVDYTGTGSWTALSAYVGDAPYVELQVAVSSSITVTGVDSTGASTSLLTSATDLSDGDPHWVEVWSSLSGANVFYELRVDGTQVDTATVAGVPGVPTAVRARPRSTSGAAGLGHVGVWVDPISSIYLAVVGPAVDGHSGEVAGRRVERLCHEEGIAIHIVGDPDETTVMGPQSTATLLDLLRQCEDADAGVLYEPREVLGLAYRCRTSLYNQPVTLALTYGAQGEVAPPLEPVDDDQRTRNDVTVTRTGGSSARYEVTSGPLSTQDPPDGVGRYDTSMEVAVRSDLQLPDLASWAAHLGTWDEARYPTIRVNLASLGAASKTALLDTAAAVDVGDRVTIDSLPAWLPPDDVDQHVEGYTETLAQYVWDLLLVCTPAGPYQVGVWESSRYDTAGCVLAADYDAGTDTSISVTTTVGSPWTTAPASFPMDWEIGGARVRVTAVSGAGVSQTATCQAATVNGVSKTILSGTAVRLWSPGRYAL